MGIVNARSGMGRLRGRRGMGVVSTMVGNNLVYGSSPVPPRSNLMRRWWGYGPQPPIMWGGPSPPVYAPTNGGYPAQWSTVGPTGLPQQAPGALNLAQLQNILNTNPGSLTADQWNTLQAAGLIAGTVAQTSAGLLPAAGSNPPVQAAPVAAPATSSILGVDPVSGATTILGIDWYYLAAAAIGLYAFMGRRGR